MTNILIVFHSQTGRTLQLAKALATGAASIEGACVRMRGAAAATTEDLLWADGIAIGTPENFGYMAEGLFRSHLLRCWR